MASFLSGLIGRKGGSGRKVECHAEDPNNCRFHHTGRFANEAREDDLTPAERELARIKSEQKKGNIGRNPSEVFNEEEDFVFGFGDDLPPADLEYWMQEDYLHDFHQPKAAVSRFGFLPKEPPKPKIRTVSEIEEEMARVATPELIKAVKALGNYIEKDSGDAVATRVSPITGKPISRECDSMINALMCGVRLADDEIMSCPEWMAAQKRYNDYEDERWRKKLPMNSWSDVSKKAEDTRKEIMRKMSARTVDCTTNPALKPGETYEVERGFRFDIVSGLPASGKNSVFADRLSTLHRARLLDADVIKTMIPGYENGIGSNIVHDESTFLNKDLLDSSFKKGDPKHGDNIVYPTLGGNSAKLVDFIEAAHDAGYKVHLHFNEIDVEKAKGRMLYRMVQTGRFLPLRLFDMTGDTVKAYSVAKAYADTAEHVKSGAGLGIDPQQVEAVSNEKPKRRPKPAWLPEAKKPKKEGGTVGYGYGSYSWNGCYRGGFTGKAKPKQEEPPKKESGMSVDDILAAFAAMKK